MATEGFPGGPLVKNLPANAGDTGSILGPGRYHMPRASKPVCHYWAHAAQRRSHHSEKPVYLNERVGPTCHN